MEISTDRNIILLGKLGAGKSHSGNGILGIKDHFRSSKGWKSVTMTCAYGSASRNGQTYRVFDTPGINSLNDMNSMMEVEKEIKRCLFCTSPGFHAIVLVLSAAERITEEDVKMVEKLNAVLGQKGFGYMMLVVTKMDDDYRALDNMIESTKPIKDLYTKCEKRRVIFGDNKEEIPKKCLQRFDEELEKLVRKNCGTGEGFFRHDLYKKATAILEKDKQDFMKKNPSASPEDVMEKVRENAALGYSPRDQELRDLIDGTDCCTVM